MGSFKLNKFKVELAQRMFKDLLTKVVQLLIDHVIRNLVQLKSYLRSVIEHLLWKCFGI